MELAAPVLSAAMIYAVLLRFDSAGVCVNIVHEDDEALMGGEGARYRLVAETEDHDEAVAVADLLQRRIAAGEFGRYTGPNPREQQGSRTTAASSEHPTAVLASPSVR